MYKSKLISTLRTLSNKELKWFEAYIISPFFNKNEKVIQLFQLIKKYHPEYEEAKVAMEVITPKLFPKETYDEQKLRYVMTDLTKLLEDYLGYIEFEKNEIFRKYLLLNAYNDRNLGKYFQSGLDETRELQKKQPHRDKNYYFNQHLLEESSYIHSLVTRPRAISTNLQEAVDNLDYYYLSNRLRYSCAILSREELLQEKYNNRFLNQIIAFMQEANLDNVPSIAIYYQIALTYLENDTDAHYQKLIQLLDKHSADFSQDEAMDMYTHALNYCVKKLNAGNVDYSSKMLSIYKTLIEKELIFDSGYITPYDVKNIVTVALRVGDVDWTENFMHTYKERITPEFRESTYTYNLANIHYHKKEFSKALKLLQAVEINDIYYHIGAKVLLLKTYFELDEQEPFYSMVDAFSNYLKRNKLITDSFRRVTLNFIKYSKKLMQMRVGNRAPSEDILGELNGLNEVANRQWLLEKLHAIQQARA